MRIIQVDKYDLDYLPDIFAQIGKRPYRYIILCDDLSFEYDVPGYKILKSVLDGTVYTSPKNVLIYVTSNRRHLLPEFHTDNLGAKMVHDEIHHGEAVEKKSPSSNRNFTLRLCRKPFARLCIEDPVEPQWNDEMARAAIKWSHEKSKGCMTSALQFAHHWLGQYLLEAEE